PPARGQSVAAQHARDRGGPSVHHRARRVLHRLPDGRAEGERTGRADRLGARRGTEDVRRNPHRRRRRRSRGRARVPGPDEGSAALIAIALLAAACVDQFWAWPDRGIVPANARILIEGRGEYAKIVAEIENHDPLLASGDHSVRLRVISTYAGDREAAQA